MLLYGPPGTGKTHTVRYLLSALTEVTAVILSGRSLQFIEPAAELTVALQPAVVVLEDVDLVAGERNPDEAQPLLFSLMEAMDGLSADADVTFVLTTNRPDLTARRALIQLYAKGLGFGAQARENAAGRTEGTTASFAKELVRRAVLVAAEAGRPAHDDDLTTALNELLDARESLTRALLGVQAP